MPFPMTRQQCRALAEQLRVLLFKNKVEIDREFLQLIVDALDSALALADPDRTLEP